MSQRGAGLAVAVLAVYLVAPGMVVAQKDTKKEGLCSVQVDHSGDDPVGGRFALALKERIKKSALFRLAESRKDAMFGVHLVSTDLALASEPKGDWSAIGVTFVAVGASSGDYFLATRIGVVGSNRLDVSVDETLSFLDKTIDDFDLRSRCK